MYLTISLPLHPRPLWEAWRKGMSDILIDLNNVVIVSNKLTMSCSGFSLQFSNVLSYFLLTEIRPILLTYELIWKIEWSQFLGQGKPCQLKIQRQPYSVYKTHPGKLPAFHTCRGIPGQDGHESGLFWVVFVFVVINASSCVVNVLYWARSHSWNTSQQEYYSEFLYRIYSF